MLLAAPACDGVPEKLRDGMYDNELFILASRDAVNQQTDTHTHMVSRWLHHKKWAVLTRYQSGRCFAKATACLLSSAMPKALGGPEKRTEAGVSRRRLQSLISFFWRLL